MCLGLVPTASESFHPDARQDWLPLGMLSLFADGLGSTSSHSPRLFTPTCPEGFFFYSTFFSMAHKIFQHFHRHYFIWSIPIILQAERVACWCPNSMDKEAVPPRVQMTSNKSRARRTLVFWLLPQRIRNIIAQKVHFVTALSISRLILMFFISAKYVAIHLLLSRAHLGRATSSRYKCLGCIHIPLPAALITLVLGHWLWENKVCTDIVSPLLHEALEGGAAFRNCVLP